PASPRALRHGPAGLHGDGRLRDPPRPLHDPPRLPESRHRRAPGGARLPARPRRRRARRAVPDDPDAAGGTLHGVRGPRDPRRGEGDAARGIQLPAREEHEPRRDRGAGPARPGPERLRSRAVRGTHEPAAAAQLHRAAAHRRGRGVVEMKKLVAFLAVSSLGGGAWLAWPGAPEASGGGAVAVVKRGDFKIFVAEQGAFAAKESVQLKVQMEGFHQQLTITKVADSGSAVKKGDVVMELD